MTEEKNRLSAEIVRRSEEKEELIKKISALDLENTKLRAMLAKNKLEKQCASQTENTSSE